VEDTGIGIPPEHHEHIFREFSQVDNPLQERHRGTGLGLPLCRNLALLLGGRIWLESAPGAGSTFYVTIPTIYVGDAMAAEEAAKLPAPDFHRAPVLVLDDNQETTHILESYLRNTEFQPILASSVAQAEMWIARHTPVAVISDVYLGEEMAWGFLSRLRERLPSLALVATSVYEESARAEESGVSLFLPKPVERETLLRELRRLTARSGTRRLLLVDDNDVSRYILRELLQQPWLQFEEARNGREAMAAVERKLPDAVILDLLMPDIGGVEVLRQLRSRPETKDLPVLVYTSKSLNEPERAQLESWRVRIVRKEDVSARLSAQPFLDWLSAVGVAPVGAVSDSHG
jgi:CheY-like chemotaxis protein